MTLPRTTATVAGPQAAITTSGLPEPAYAIGDIHGCFETLRAFFTTNDIDDTDRVIYCGDFVDRGPCIRETLDFILAREHDIVLLGNHDFAFVDWFELGGQERNAGMYSQGLSQTLDQLGKEAEAYAQALAKRSRFVYHDKHDRYVFCHADYNWRDDETFSTTGRIAVTMARSSCTVIRRARAETRSKRRVPATRPSG